VAGCGFLPNALRIRKLSLFVCLRAIDGCERCERQTCDRRLHGRCPTRATVHSDERASRRATRFVELDRRTMTYVKKSFLIEAKKLRQTNLCVLWTHTCVLHTWNLLKCVSECKSILVYGTTAQGSVRNVIEWSTGKVGEQSDLLLQSDTYYRRSRLRALFTRACM